MPAIIHILNQPQRQPGDGPIALVLAPTRELAQQIQKVADDFGKSSRIQNTVLYGGTSKAFQLTHIRRGVATTSLNLRRCTYLVLDEGNYHISPHFMNNIPISHDIF